MKTKWDEVWRGFEKWKYMSLWLLISQWGAACISENKGSQRQALFAGAGNLPLVLAVPWNLLFIGSPRLSVLPLAKLPFRISLSSKQTLVLFSTNSIFFPILKFFHQISLPFPNSRCQCSQVQPMGFFYIYIHPLSMCCGPDLLLQWAHQSQI